MKLAAFLVIASVCAAQAQTFPLTDKNGVTMGTVTFDKDRAYLRDLKQELIGTVVTLPDGTKTAYDAEGRVVRKVLPEERR